MQPTNVATGQALFSREEQAEECRLQKERKNAFHGQRLADDASGHARKLGPVGSELKFHRNSCNYAHDEIDPENARPKTGGLIVDRIIPAYGNRLQN